MSNISTVNNSIYSQSRKLKDASEPNSNDNHFKVPDFILVTKTHSNFTGMKMSVNSIRYDKLSNSNIYTCQASDGFEYQFSEYDILHVDN